MQQEWVERISTLVTAFLGFSKRLLTPLMFLAALYVFAMEWLWERMKGFAQYITRLRIIARLEEKVRKLSSGAVVGFFLTGGGVLFLLKILILMLIANGFFILGLIAFLALKVVGAACTAWYFKLVKPTLMQYAWCAAIIHFFERITAWAHAWAHKQPIFQRLVEFKERYACVHALMREYLKETLFPKTRT